MATQARTRRLHFLVLFSILSTSVIRVNSLEQFYGTCGSTYDLMQTNTQSALLKVPMPTSMAAYQDPSRDIKCDIILTFTHGMNLLIELYFVDIIPQTADRKTCDTGLEIFDQMGRKYYGGRICGEAWEWEERHQSNKQQKMVIESSPLTFRLYSSSPYKGEGFRVHINQFRPYWPCYTREFKCQQIQRCVHDDLACDGWDDCGDNSDEREEAGCHLLTPSEICGIIIGILLLVGTVIFIVFFAVTYHRLAQEYGLRSDSKVPIAMNETKNSIDPVLTFNTRYNSQESMSRMSKSTMNRQYSDYSLDKDELEKADRYSIKDNMSERSIRSNPRKNRGLSQTNEVAEPVKKNGQYSTRRGRSSSQNSLNREKGEPPVNGLDNKGMGNRDSAEKDRPGSRGRDRRSYDRRSPEDSEDERRFRRRSRDRSRDRYYSDEDSDYDRDRDRKRRRRSYDRYSDDSDYEYERDRRRRSRDRYRDRYDDSDRDSDRPPRRSGSREKDRVPGEDEKDGGRRTPPRRLNSRERDRDRYRDDDERDRGRRSPYDDEDDYRPRRRSRRSRSGDRRRDYDDEDRPPRKREPSPERPKAGPPPKYDDELNNKRSRSKENLDDAPLPPPPTGEEVRRMELAKQKAAEPVKPAEVFKPVAEAPKPAYQPPKPAYQPPKQPQPPRPYWEQQKPKVEPPRVPVEPARPVAEPPKPQFAPAKSEPEPPKQKWEPSKPRETGRNAREPARAMPDAADDNARKRNSSDRRERYSKNRFSGNRIQDSPPPEYEDVAPPKSVNIKAAYKEESV